MLNSCSKEESFIRLLFLSNNFSRKDGWATVAHYLYHELKQRSDVEIKSLGFDNKDRAKDGLGTIRFWNHSSGLGTLIGDLIRNFLALKRYHPEIILCNIEPLLPLAYLMKVLVPGCKLVLIGHGTYAYYPFVKGRKSFLFKLLSKGINGLFVPSQFTLKKVRNWYQGTITLVPWGVDQESFFPTKVVKEKTFLFVGEAKERKGIEALLLAMKKLQADGLPVKLAIIGKTNSYLESLIDKNQLNNIEVTGALEHSELLNYYSKSLAHILPSVNTDHSFEGFGLVHLEANACGCLSIGSLDTANEEIISEGVSGFLVAQRSPEDLAQVMKKIYELDEQGELPKLRLTAREHSQKYSWKKAGDIVYQGLSQLSSPSSNLKEGKTKCLD